MKNTNIIIRIEEELKNDFQEIANNNHYTISNIIIACIKDIVRRKKIPINLLPYLNSKPNNKINIPLIKRALFEILEQNSINNVEKAYLFGSYARGEETYESDIDIRLEVKDSFSLIDLSFISSELKEKLNKDIDVISSGGLDKNFLNRIKKDEICIYENK